MSQIERDTMKQIDAEILSASPELLKLIQKHDLENQLSGNTIYDIYSTILKKLRDQSKPTPKTK
tara:strand:- start:34 stop:225 length:192 start_codon:yes stop_codon:yes gene_type:complete